MRRHARLVCEALSFEILSRLRGSVFNEAVAGYTGKVVATFVEFVGQMARMLHGYEGFHELPVQNALVARAQTELQANIALCRDDSFKMLS